MLHHLEIYVADLDKSRAFWGWLLEWLGWTLYQDFENGFSYQSPEGGYLVFVQTRDKHLEAGYNRCRTGLNHLAFKAPSPQAIADLTEALKSRQVSILYPDSHPHAGRAEHTAVYFEDPDRIKVEYCV